MSAGLNYSTPTWAVDKLIDREPFTGSVWDPACGSGRISSVFEKRGFKVYSSDILNHGYGIFDVDFLSNNSLLGLHHQYHDNVVTNVPFNKALDFLKMAKKYGRQKIAFLAKTTLLEGVERQEMFTDREFPFKKMYQFVRRLTFYGDTEPKKNGGMLAFGWFIWEKGYEGKPEIDWID